MLAPMTPTWSLRLRLQRELLNHALGGIEMWGFAQWSVLDDTLAIVAAALQFAAA